MISVRRSDDRGLTRTSWLESRHTFSFDTYHDPDHMGFRSLRVINEDRVAPGNGFPLHHHANMEVLSLVLEGHLKHEDDLGHGSVIGPRDVQRFSAGTGIRHSEYNPSEKEEVHFLQIWILPERENLSPGYEQKTFPAEACHDRFTLIASYDGREGSATIYQNICLWRSRPKKNTPLSYHLSPGRHAWVQVISGHLSIAETELRTGDGAAISEVENLRFMPREDSDLLLFDLA